MCVASGNIATYPLRAKIYSTLPQIRSIKVYTKKSHTLTFEEYIRRINQAKIFAFGNVNRSVGTSPTLIFAMAKIYEIMACGTLCLMDRPDMARQLHLIPDKNFVEVDGDNYIEKIKYYLGDNNDRRKIARTGYEMVMRYHTIQVRGMELKEQLEELIKK